MFNDNEPHERIRAAAGYIPLIQNHYSHFSGTKIIKTNLVKVGTNLQRTTMPATDYWYSIELQDGRVFMTFCIKRLFLKYTQF
jgi:hypothetical protein